MPENLLPCPFCGGEATLRSFHGVSFYVVCEKCNAGTDTFDKEGDGVLAAWNHRALPEEAIREAARDIREFIFCCGSETCRDCGQCDEAVEAYEAIIRRHLEGTPQ